MAFRRKSGELSLPILRWRWQLDWDFMGFAPIECHVDGIRCLLGMHALRRNQ